MDLVFETSVLPVSSLPRTEDRLDNRFDEDFAAIILLELFTNQDFVAV